MAKIRFISCLLSLLLLAGCADMTTIVSKNDPEMPTTALSTDFARKDFKTLGRLVLL